MEVLCYNIIKIIKFAVTVNSESAGDKEAPEIDQCNSAHLKKQLLLPLDNVSQVNSR